MGHEGDLEDPSQMQDTTVFQKMNSLEIMEEQVKNEDLLRAHLVRTRGYPNRYGAKIPVDSRWNLTRLEENYKDMRTRR